MAIILIKKVIRTPSILCHLSSETEMETVCTYAKKFQNRTDNLRRTRTSLKKLSENGGESKLTFERTPVILGGGRDHGYVVFLLTFAVCAFFTGRPDKKSVLLHNKIRPLRLLGISTNLDLFLDTISSAVDLLGLRLIKFFHLTCSLP